MESVKRHIREGVELPNQVVIRTPEEKKTNKYLEILETDTIKQAEMKEELESCSRQISVAGTLSKG